MPSTPQPHLDATAEYELFRGAMGDSTIALLNEKKPVEITLNDLAKPPHNLPVMDIFDRSVHAALDAVDQKFKPNPIVKRALYGLIANQFESVMHGASEHEPDCAQALEYPPKVSAKTLKQICTELPAFYAVPTGEFYQELTLMTPFYQAIHNPITLKKPIIIPPEYEALKTSERGKWLLRSRAHAAGQVIDEEALANHAFADSLESTPITLHPTVEVEKLHSRLIKTLQAHASEFFSLPPESDHSTQAQESRNLAVQKVEELLKFSDRLIKKEYAQMKGDNVYDQAHHLSPTASATFLLDAMELARFSPDIESLQADLSSKSEWFKDQYKTFKAESGPKADRTPRTVAGSIRRIGAAQEPPKDPTVLIRQ